MGGIGSPDDGIVEERTGYSHTIRATKSADFTKYFDSMVEEMKEKHLPAIGEKKWNELDNHKALRRIRIHRFKPLIYSMCRYVLFHHYFTIGNAAVMFCFEYNTKTGLPVCAIDGCMNEPMRLISKVTQSHLILYGIIICSPHADMINNNEQLFHHVIDAKIFLEIRTSPAAMEIFPEYVARMRLP